MQWSELQRDPKGVAALADAGDVRVRQRDGADLLLTREDRLSTSGEGAIATVRALRNLLAHVPVETAAGALSEEFPWLSLLPADAMIQIHADPDLLRQLSGPLHDDLGPIPVDDPDERPSDASHR